MAKPKQKAITLITTKVLEANVQQPSGVIYTRESLQSMVDSFKPGLGEYLHGSEHLAATIDSSRVSHQINALYLSEDGNSLMADLMVLETPRGKLIDDDTKFATVSIEVASPETLVDEPLFLQVVAFHNRPEANDASA